jgi:hypothetical protein
MFRATPPSGRRSALDLTQYHDVCAPDCSVND